MDIYKIDITGDDLLSKGYGVIVLFNNEHPYAYKFSSSLQAEIRNYFNKKLYGFENKKILKPRAYSAILGLLLRQISKENQTETKNFDLHICNDFDGHQNDIIHLLKENATKMFIFGDITSDNYHFRKHSKKSKIQQLAIQVSRGNWTGINKVKIDRKEFHSLVAKKKFKKRKW